MVAADLYSQPNITAERSRHSRHTRRGASRPTHSWQIAFWQIAQMPAAGRFVCVKQFITQPPLGPHALGGALSWRP